MQNQFVVKPVESKFTPQSADKKGFVYNAPPFSLSILRIPVTKVCKEEVESELFEGEEGWEDITDRVVNPDFTDRQTGWSGKFSAADGIVAEFFNTNFNSYQVLDNMPAGEYKFCVDGFYRNGNIEPAYRSHVKGTEELNARIYMRVNGRSKYAPLMSLYDESALYTYSPSYNYPDNVTGANLAFNFKGAYKGNEVRSVLTTDGGQIRLGFIKTTSVTNDWTCFDNVRLYYRPLEYTSIEGVMSDGGNTVHAVYDLTGRRVTNPSKGIYIVDGKLKLVK
jgi:hypothetical protein